MPTELLRKEERRVVSPPPPSPPPLAAVPIATSGHAERVRRLKLNAVAWGLGTILLTTLWVVVEWRANGALERFGHEGDPGEWNPTLWALAVGAWGLVVGIMALAVYLAGRRLHFHVAAWTLGLLVLTPLWALIEWQDNGAFERWSNDGHPGDWDPWILTVGAVWAFVAAILVLRARRRRLRA